MADERDEGDGLAPETRAITAGRASNQSALAPILWATTTFTYDTVDEGRRLVRHRLRESHRQQVEGRDHGQRPPSSEHSDDGTRQ